LHQRLYDVDFDKILQVRTAIYMIGLDNLNW